MIDRFLSSRPTADEEAAQFMHPFRRVPRSVQVHYARRAADLCQHVEAACERLGIVPLPEERSQMDHARELSTLDLRLDYMRSHDCGWEDAASAIPDLVRELPGTIDSTPLSEPWLSPVSSWEGR